MRLNQEYREDKMPTELEKAREEIEEIQKTENKEEKKKGKGK